MAEGETDDLLYGACRAVPGSATQRALSHAGVTDAQVRAEGRPHHPEISQPRQGGCQCRTPCSTRDDVTTR